MSFILYIWVITEQSNYQKNLSLRHANGPKSVQDGSQCFSAATDESDVDGLHPIHHASKKNGVPGKTGRIQPSTAKTIKDWMEQALA